MQQFVVYNRPRPITSVSFLIFPYFSFDTTLNSAGLKLWH